MTNLAVFVEAFSASATAARIASTTSGSARPNGSDGLVTRPSASAGRPPDSHRWRRRLTIEAVTGCPAAASSAALACSRAVSVVTAGSKPGLGRVPGTASGGRP